MYNAHDWIFGAKMTCISRYHFPFNPYCNDTQITQMTFNDTSFILLKWECHYSNKCTINDPLPYPSKVAIRSCILMFDLVTQYQKVFDLEWMIAASVLYLKLLWWKTWYHFHKAYDRLIELYGITFVVIRICSIRWKDILIKSGIRHHQKTQANFKYKPVSRQIFVETKHETVL